MKQPFYYQIPYPFPPVTFNLNAEDLPHLSLSYFLLVVISVSITTIYSPLPLQGGDLHSTLEINMEVNESHAHATSYLLLATCARVHHEA
jgi:hypothetical protein